MNAGQMLYDVKAFVEGRAPVHFYGRMGGSIPLPDEVLRELMTLATAYDLHKELPSVVKPAGGNGHRTIETLQALETEVTR
jgi:hypothetical protein